MIQVSSKLDALAYLFAPLLLEGLMNIHRLVRVFKQLFAFFVRTIVYGRVSTK
jgi:hypothetical protein